MEKEEIKVLPDRVTLSDGRIVEKKKDIKVRHLAAAGNQPKGKEYLIPYSTIAAKILIDGAIAVLEDILDMTEDDFLLVSSMFVDEDDLKNG